MLSTVDGKFPLRQISTPSKIGQRAKNIAIWRAASGLKRLAASDAFVTLGGLSSLESGKVIPNSEYDQVVLQERLCTPLQYVSIEGKDPLVQKRNIQINGPTWIWGDFGQSFADWYVGYRHASFINADLMNGIDVALETISIIFDVIRENQRANKFSLVVFNIIERNLVRENFTAHDPEPFKFSPVWETFRNNKLISEQSKQFVLEDRSSYWSGPHLQHSLFVTLAFSYRT